MRAPVSPPVYDDVSRSIANGNMTLFMLLMRGAGPVDSKGRYLHWDELRHLPAPVGLNHDEWWFGMKSARRNLYQSLPLRDKHAGYFQFAPADKILRELHWLDRLAVVNRKLNESITNTTRATYLIRSMVEEAFNSSQLEGASTSKDVARTMIRQGREPADKSEQMILNNYHAMQYIGAIKNEELTPSIIFKLHRILTRDTLNDDEAGQLRRNDNVFSTESVPGSLHVPPSSHQLEKRLEILCAFANKSSANLSDAEPANAFLHPVIKAIVLHYMLAYDQPFSDGNGCTARALFYWVMAREGYDLMEFISISRVIKRKPEKYNEAFLYAETDDNDLTYFIIHQLEVIHQAIDDLHRFLDGKMQSVNETEQLLVDNPRLRGKLSFRQLALLQHALNHPRFSYVVHEHQNTHGVSYDIARKDLLDMADNLKLLLKTKQGKRYYFVVPDDLRQRLAKR